MAWIARFTCDRAPVTQPHTAHFGKRVKMAAEEVVDSRDLRAQRKRIPHGNTRAKPLDYIGQVFECKADRPPYSGRLVANPQRKRVTHEKRDSRDVQTLPLCVAPFLQVSPVSLEQDSCTCSKHVVNHANDGSVARSSHAACELLHSLTSPTSSHSIESCHASKCAKP